MTTRATAATIAMIIVTKFPASKKQTNNNLNQFAKADNYSQKVNKYIRFKKTTENTKFSYEGMKKKKSGKKFKYETQLKTAVC